MIRTIKLNYGFTLIELLVVVTIIVLLVAIISVNYNIAKNKGRYTRVLEDMKLITNAVEINYDNQQAYLPDVGPNTDPGLGSSLLPNDWPIPPCIGWTYDWENWVSGTDFAVRITLRKTNFNAVYFYCIYTNTEDCFASWGGSPIQNVPNRQISCNE